MDIINKPLKLAYNNGNIFPSNFLMIIYVLLAGSVGIIVTGTSIIVGVILLLLCISLITNRNIVEINVADNFIHDYSLYLGFIKLGKKYPLDKYKYVTTMPLIESHTVMANYAQTTTDTNVSTAVTFFGDRLRGKRIITKCKSRKEAQETATQLADGLGLKYFQYDPKLVRDVLTGRRTL